MIYIDGYPAPLYDAIVDTHGKAESATQSLWLSQPRTNADDTTETIRYYFPKAASLSAIELKVLQAGVHVEVFYRDREGHVLPLLQTSRQAIAFDTTFSSVNQLLLPSIGDSRQVVNDLAWGTYSFECYPVIVTNVEIRMSRIVTPAAPQGPYPVGLKDVLLKRSITTRKDAASPVLDTIDTLGNQVSHTVSDWTADKSIDDSITSYWKSEPQPSPDAVTSLYLDVTDDNGDAQWIDHFFIDPVSAGQQMNVYWSNDDSVGPSLPSESALTVPYTSATYDSGLILGDTDSKVSFDPSMLDPNKSHWVGLQWTPHFDSSANKLSTFWSWGDLSFAYDAGNLVLTAEDTALELPMPAFSAGEKTFNIVFAINLADASYQGRYIAFCEKGKTSITDTNALGKPLIDNESERSFFVNDVEVPLSSYFSLLDNRLTPVPGAFKAGDVAKLTLSNPGIGVAGTTKRLSFESTSSVKWGGRVGEVPDASTVVVKSASSTIHTAEIPRTIAELSPNPLLDKDASLPGIIAGTAPLGNAVMVGTDPSWFDMQPYINGKKGDRIYCSYLTKPTYGQGNAVPVIGDISGTELLTLVTSTPSVVESLQNGWYRYSCTITLTADITSAKLGFRVLAFDTDAQALVGGHNITKERSSSPWTHVSLPTTAVKSLDLIYRHGPGEMTVSIPTVVTTPHLPSFNPSGNPAIKACYGKLTNFIVKQAPATPEELQLFLLSPDTYVLPDPAPDLDSRYSTLSNAVIVGRLSFENVFRGGVDGTKFTSKRWTPVFSDWILSRRWYYLPYAIRMKYLKLEFSNLVLEPYPVWEDGIKVTYQTFPISVTETSTHIANLDISKTETTKTVDTTITNTSTTTGPGLTGLTSTQAFHDRAVTKSSASSAQLSEIDMPREYEIIVGRPITTNFPPAANIRLETEFHEERANAALYKGSETTTSSTSTSSYITSTSTRQAAREVTKTWTESVIAPTTKWVAQDIYYTVKPGDYLVKIAEKLGIPDWKVIYAYNSWLQTDYRVALLPARPAGWWIFPGQVFRIPGAVMKQVTTYTTTKATRHSTETVYDTVVDTTVTTSTTDTKTTVTTNREDSRITTTSTTRNRFRDESVHKYAQKTVTRKDKYAYFVAIRDIIVAKTNWLTERDTRLFDFVDYESDGWTMTGITREGALYRPSGEYPTGQLISPEYKTVSEFRTIKLIGSQRDALRRNTPVPNLTGYSPTPPPSETAWVSDHINWRDMVTPWGSHYTKPFSPLTITPSGTNLIVAGGTGTNNVSFIASSWSCKKGETVGGRMLITPASVSGDVTMELRLVDLDNSETLALLSGKENILIPGQQNMVDWPSWLASRDVDNLAMVAILLDKGAMSWVIGNPVHSTGTIRILARNDIEASFEDVTHSVNDLSSQYTFSERGRSLEIRIEMSDLSDWTSRLQVIPLYLTDDLRA